MRSAVLSIWIPKQGHISQGKFCYIGGKPYFIANMTADKWFRNYAGYAISKRILDALPRGTTIVYKRLDLGTYYIANRTRFEKKGILVAFGGHSQWVLPLKQWGAKAGQIEEPHQLPVMDLEDWKKEKEPYQTYTHNLYDLKRFFEEKYPRASL